MATITLFGLDIGKHSFHLVGQNANGKPVFKRQFTCSSLIYYLAQHPACRIVIEACCGAHWLARQLAGFSHQVQLIAPQYVRPFVTGNKNDFLDAHAICEAASHPSMRYVGVKTPEQQASSALHRLREARMPTGCKPLIKSMPCCSSLASCCRSGLWASRKSLISS